MMLRGSIDGCWLNSECRDEILTKTQQEILDDPLVEQWSGVEGTIDGCWLNSECRDEILTKSQQEILDDPLVEQRSDVEGVR